MWSSVRRPNTADMGPGPYSHRKCYGFHTPTNPCLVVLPVSSFYLSEFSLAGNYYPEG